MSAAFTAESLATRFDHASAQARIYSEWEQGDYFHAEPDANRTPFTIVIPPPNVTGALHLGHALNNSLQDILIRMKRMQGYQTLWMPGTDHAGIATQAVVEKRLKEEEGQTRHDLGREKLVERIWQWKDEYEARIIQQLKSMGCSCDWQRTRFTLDDVCARAVRRTFFDLFQKRLIYRGKRLVNWDTFLQTAVSDDEVFHDAVKGHFWHFRYPVMDPAPGEPEYVTIATTRPETMLGDTAVAVHPNPAEALEAAEAELHTKLATAPAKEKEGIAQQIEQIQQRRESVLPGLEQLRDMALAGRKLRLPLLNREIPLIVDAWAKPELGSGCVKITPAHDANDYEVGLRCQLPMINILNPEGTLNSNAGPYEGLTIPKARKRVVADLEDQELLVEVEDREIDLAHSDRSKTPIEPYLADQWFVQMGELAQSAMDAVEDGRVQITPTRYAKGYLDWLSEKRDWPVSRQLWWGHRIPIWSKSFTDHIAAQGCVEKLQQDPHVQSGRVAIQMEEPNGDAADPAQAQAEIAVQICIRDDGDDLVPEYEALGFVQDQDVLDTWFSSALWPHSTLGWPTSNPDLDYFYPTSVLITSRDIITLWVARMVLTGLNNMGQVPFSNVFIHPKILDGYGETMSKSKGNGVDPIDVIEKFGADSLRFGLAHLTTETQDVRMPVQFECPHCSSLVEQTKKNRDKPRIDCDKCQKPFRTQWARNDDDLALRRGAVVSERFELARNFCNKLWNASRLILLNLDGYQSAPVTDVQLEFEDRWLLSRLTAATQTVTEALDGYQFADAARTVYDFAWDDFCSSYLEMIKTRLLDPERRGVAQRVVAFALDQLLRLLHPMIPFITEEVWELLGRIAPERGLSDPQSPSDRLIVAAWPEADAKLRNPKVEERFQKYNSVLRALREIRSRQNILDRKPITFLVQCDAATAELLEPMAPFYKLLTNATVAGMGQQVTPPQTNARVQLTDMEVYVDLAGLIDVEAERQRLDKQRQRLEGTIAGKEKKLANAGFVSRAPAEVVQRERDSLDQLRDQLKSVSESLAGLEKAGS
jgi:valyl-tRNA synthetase